MSSIETKIQAEMEKLKANLSYEEEQYRVCLEYPTNTPQFYSALDKHFERIGKMRKELEEIENSSFSQ